MKSILKSCQQQLLQDGMLEPGQRAELESAFQELETAWNSDEKHKAPKTRSAIKRICKALSKYQPHNENQSLDE